ncbi:NAD-dependent deacylase [Thermoleophilia bacterium SCSIO 60948]|nr:NAD-dependent deacylase [Thermoleophilia bacterium SCSIO 60948]
MSAGASAGEGSAGSDPARVAELAELVRGAGSTVVLTGAGVSVPSGIPDFRSPGTGMWENVNPFEVAHIDAFHRDSERFWSFYRPRFHMLGDKQPNPAHVAIAELEAAGHIDGVITQNIDRLHRMAGSREIVEMHGSIATSSCLSCGSRYELEAVDALFADDGVAYCAECGGRVKPDVVLFGEMLDMGAIERAERLTLGADLMICVGSSLEVYPVAGLPQAVLGNGGQVALVTQGETPFDDVAMVKLDGDVAEEMRALAGALS